MPSGRWLRYLQAELQITFFSCYILLSCKLTQLLTVTPLKTTAYLLCGKISVLSPQNVFVLRSPTGNKKEPCKDISKSVHRLPLPCLIPDWMRDHIRFFFFPPEQQRCCLFSGSLRRCPASGLPQWQPWLFHLLLLPYIRLLLFVFPTRDYFYIRTGYRI